MIIELPRDLENWARAEVAAGRAESVDALIARLLDERRFQLSAFDAAGHSQDVAVAYRALAAGDVVEEAAADLEIDQLLER